MCPSAERPSVGASSSYDVVIVGGGVIGSSIAYFLASSSDFDGRVLVVERDPGHTESSTGRSVGGIRQQFSSPENIEMSLFAVEFVRTAGERLRVGDDVPELSFVENGYLFLASPAGWDTLQANHAEQRRLGGDISLLRQNELAAKFPWLNVTGLVGGAFGETGEGWIDPYSLMQAFRRKAIDLGAGFLQDEVVGLERDGGRIAAVRLASGDRIAAGHVVNAAGPRCALVAEMVGIDIPVRPRKRLVYTFHCREEVPDCPLTIDPTGVYVRPESGNFICGVSPSADNDPDCLDLEITYDLFDEVVWPTLAHRIPAFEAIKPGQAWAGHYAYNTVDQNAILGPHPEISNFHLANGFSGHGLQQSPAVGRAIAELISFGAYRSLDLSRFDFARFAEGRPVHEINVV